VKYQRKDPLYRRAKAEGYRARSAYKLVELDDRFHVLTKGARVVDLGAWPGGWCQVAAERVGPSGRVLGVDLVEIAPIPGGNVETLVGDVRDPATIDAITARLGGPADVVLCDVAPKLTGVRDVDESRCAELLAAVIDVLPHLLRAGGSAIVKTFMDAAHREHRARLEARFRELKTTRAESSRRGSAELYLVGRGFLGPSSACG
jgi:23S rRNA (uridine2552-2'-O)-methyltransferase